MEIKEMPARWGDVYLLGFNGVDPGSWIASVVRPTEITLQFQMQLEICQFAVPSSKHVLKWR